MYLSIFNKQKILLLLLCCKMLPLYFAFSVLWRLLILIVLASGNPHSLAAELLIVPLMLVFIILPISFQLLAPFYVSLYRLIVCNSPIDTNYYGRLFNSIELSYLRLRIKCHLIFILLITLFLILYVKVDNIVNWHEDQFKMNPVFISYFYCGLAYIIFIILTSRLLLVFPSISIDQKLGFYDSHKLLKGYAWKFFIGLFLASVPLMVSFLFFENQMFFAKDSLIPVPNLDHSMTTSELLGLTMLVLMRNVSWIVFSIPVVFVIAHTFKKIRAENSPKVD